MWEAQYWQARVGAKAGHLGRPRHDGLCAPAAIGAKFARPEEEVWVVVGDGGFQMTACELSTIAQEGIKIHVADHQQRLPGHGPPVAGVLLRRPLRGDAAARSRLREARRGSRAYRPSRHGEERDRRAQSKQRARAKDTDGHRFRVEQEDSVYPMVPAGADLHDMIRRPSPSWTKTGRPLGTDTRARGDRLMTSVRTFIAYRRGSPGVLNRVTSLFRRRSVQHRVAHRRAHRAPGISRMTSSSRPTKTRRDASRRTSTSS